MELPKPGRVQMLPVNAIEPSPYQARTAFDETEIASLAVSILQNGLLQPISVRRCGARRYQLVAGERRLRACRLARLERVPALVVDLEEGESAALGLLENLQRTQLDPFDTARGIREVIRLWGCTQAEAARRLGLSQPALANKLRLLTLTPEQQRICTIHRLSERHARAVLRLPPERRTAALQKIAREGLSVRAADRLVEQLLCARPGDPSPLRRTTPMVRDMRLFVNTLQHAVELMTQKGIPATTSCSRGDGYLEYIIRIPDTAPAAAAPPDAAPGPIADGVEGVGTDAALGSGLEDGLENGAPEGLGGCGPLPDVGELCALEQALEQAPRPPLPLPVPACDAADPFAVTLL